MLAIVLEAQGRKDEAMRELAGEPADWARLTGLGALHARSGRMAESEAALRELESRYADNCAYQIAIVHACRGDHDAAFAWFDRAYEERDSGVAYTVSEPVLRPLHGDPRWQAMLERLGIRPPAAGTPGA
jgi:tetratricopeptide (TPR) repeat protein